MPAVNALRGSVLLQQMVAVPVVQRVLEGEDIEELSHYLVRFFKTIVAPDLEIQNELFDYLCENYDTYEDAKEKAAEEYYRLLDQRGMDLTEDKPKVKKEEGKKEEGKREKEKEHAASPEMEDDVLANIDLDEITFTAATYKTILENYSAINGFMRKQKYKEIRTDALQTLNILRQKDNISPLPKSIFTQLSAITVKFLAANEAAIDYSDAKSLANKNNLEEAQKGIMRDCVKEFKVIAGIDFRRPDGIIRTPGALTTKTDSRGKSHQLGTGYAVITGLLGSRSGDGANTMTASVALNEIYRLTLKNAFVAGHLVTKGAGGKGENDNLAPTTGYFNQGGIRTPESRAEGLMRQDKVLSYSAQAVYGRSHNDGSEVDFHQKDLEMIPKHINVKVVELGLKQDGDPTKLADWTTEVKTHFNNSVVHDLSAVETSEAFAF